MTFGHHLGMVMAHMEKHLANSTQQGYLAAGSALERIQQLSHIYHNFSRLIALDPVCAEFESSYREKKQELGRDNELLQAAFVQA
jgi:hypothetical protein